MRRVVFGVCIALFFGLSTPAYALDGAGTIQEIRVCTITGTRHKNLMLYRLSDGNWFGAYAHFYDGTNLAYSGDTASQSLILMAFANNLPVQVRATYTSRTQCGVEAHLQWGSEGDYIILKRD